MPRTQGTERQGSTADADSEAMSGSKAEAKGRLLRTEVRPHVVEKERCVLEGGDSSTFRRRLIWQVHSSKFVDKRIPQLDKSKEHVEKRLREIDSYKSHAGQSLTVETEDGYGLIVFMKRGMYDHVPLGTEKDLRERSENAFHNLVSVYPPLVPKDRRHEDAVASWVDRGLFCGLMHFMYWYENGHPDGAPDVSLDSCPKDPARLEAVTEFIKDVSWENEPIDKLMTLSDPKSREKFHNHTQKLRQDGLLKHLDQGPHAVNSSIVSIVNLTVQPHRDHNDARDGWTSTNAWGNYEGAWIVFPDLGIMIEQRPGDIMLCRSQYLEHWVTKITSGQRYCCTRMTKDNIINPLEKWVRCPVLGCDWKSGRVASIRPHVYSTHFQLTDADVNSTMNNINANFPEFSDKDVKAIGSILRVRMTKQNNKVAKKKAKRQA